MFMHFFSILLLALTWVWDLVFYTLQLEIYDGSDWEKLDYCSRKEWHHVMFWKAILDCVPTEFILDLVVLYLIIVFAKDTQVEID